MALFVEDKNCWDSIESKKIMVIIVAAVGYQSGKSVIPIANNGFG